MEFDDTFNCSGKVNSNDWQLSRTSLLLRGEVENILYRTKEYFLSEENVQLFDNVQPASVAALDISHLTKCMEMQLKIMNRHESSNRLGIPANNNTTDFYRMRKSVGDFISYIRIYLISLEQQSHEARESFLEMKAELDETLDALRRFFARLREIPESIFHYAASNLGNKCSQPEFHLYHMHLELRWLFITIVHTRISYSQSCNVRIGELESTLQLVIDDLVYVSMKMFERIDLTDLSARTPYSCTCARELWLMIQLFVEDVTRKIKSKTFWEYVNSSLNKILSPQDNSDEKKLYWHHEEEKDLPQSKNPELFSAWLIFHLTLLHGYDSHGNYVGTNSNRITPNYEAFDKIIKGFVRKGGKDEERDGIDEELRVIIPLLRILLDEWWPTRVQIITLLWDCFHRRLEKPFLIQTSGPWAISIEKKIPADILKQIRDRIDGNCDQSKESSYGMFLRFLGIFLKKTYNKNDTRHWNQVKGRIYSKFSKNKVQEFGEAGLYNFISLFLTIAVTADTTNVCSVMLELLPSVQEPNDENSKRANLSWKGKLAILLLYNENSLSLESIASNLTEVVNVISCRKDENSRSMMSNFVEIFGRIISSSDKFDKDEYLFVGGWIDRYILECPKNRIGNLMKILLEIFAKCSRLENTGSDSGAFKILDALWSFVASRIRQLVFEPVTMGDNYIDLAKLATAFTLEALKNPVAAKRHQHSAASLFQHFTSSIAVKDVRITKSYIAAILQKKSVAETLKFDVKNFDLIVVQAWIKCCVLDQDANQDEEIRILKNSVVSLPEIGKFFESQAEIFQFVTKGASIFAFFSALAKHRNSLQTDQERNLLDSRVRLYFNNIDKWALVPITEESKDTDLAFGIYRCIGTLVLCCSPMLYVKSQSNNALRVLVNKFILPTDQSPQTFLKDLGKRIFSMILLGIEALSARNDLALQGLIRDLFDSYLPLLVTEQSGNFKISESLLQCFADAKIDFCCLIFENLAASFIIVSGDNVTHRHCYLVMRLLRTLLKSGKSYGNHVVEFIVTICVPNVISCYFKVHDLHPHKMQTLDVIADVTNNSYYREDSVLRNKFHTGVVTVVLKFLTFYSQCAFDFLRALMKINKQIVDVALPQIERCVEDLEKSRRPNAASLRYSLSQLQSLRKIF